MSKGYILIISNKESPDVIKIVRTPVRPQIKTEDFIGIKASDDISTIIYYAFFKNFNKARYNIFKVLSKNKIKTRRKLFTLTKKVTLRDVIEIISKMKGKIYDRNLYHYVFEAATLEEIQQIVDENDKEPEMVLEDDEPEEDDSQYENDDYEEEEDEEEKEEEPVPIPVVPVVPEPVVNPAPIEKTEEIPTPKKSNKNYLIYILILFVILLLLAFCRKKPEIINVAHHEEVVIQKSAPSYTVCDLNDAIKSNNLKEVKDILSTDLIGKIVIDLSVFDTNIALFEEKFSDYVYNYDCKQHPLLTAIASNSSDVISLLVNYGGNLLSFGKYQTPVMTAVRLKSKIDTFKTLFKHFNINEKNLFNETALMFVSTYNPNKALLKLFIDSNVAVDVRDNDNNTALIYALKSNRDKDFIELLLSHTDSDSECILKRLDDNAKCIKLGLQTKKNLLLLTAIKSNVSLNVIEMIINIGADVNFFDFYGKTSIKYAKEINNKELIDLLNNKGAIDFEKEIKSKNKTNKNI